MIERLPFLKPMAARWSRLSPFFKGVLCMLASGIMMTMMQALIRKMSQEIHPLELVFFRNLFALLILSPVFLKHGFGILRTGHLRFHVIRGIFQVGSMTLFFLGISMTPLAEVSALNFITPIIVTILAGFTLGEKVGLNRWTAVAGGFIGAMIVIRPGFTAVGWGPILVLASTLFWAGAVITIKVLSRTESSLTATLYLSVIVLPFAFVPAVFVWQWPALDQLVTVFFLAMFGTAGHLCFAQALKYADATAMMPVEFTRLIWASVVGYLMFVELPGAWTWIGGAVIFLSSFYITWSESRKAKLGG
ncbi:MAG: DMT family transporter [Alphaproteobacteria bacterium]